MAVIHFAVYSASAGWGKKLAATEKSRNSEWNAAAGKSASGRIWLICLGETIEGRRLLWHARLRVFILCNSSSSRLIPVRKIDFF